MAKEVIMPALGMAQETGTLLRWLKQEGDSVNEGEPLMEVATDKVDVEIEAPASGVLADVRAAEGDEIPVGQAIALILAPGESAPTSPAKDQPQPISADALTTEPKRAASNGGVPASPVAARMAAEHNLDLSQIEAAGNRIQKEDVLAYLKQQEASTQPHLVPGPGRVLASPKARRLAVEQGVDLTTMDGTGPDGAVLAADVVQAARRAEMVQPQARPHVPDTAPAESGEVVPVSRMWQVMAQRLSQSWTSVPHFYLVREVDASALVAWRGEVKARVESVTYTDLLVKLVAIALERHPRVNAGWRDGEIVVGQGIHVGLAVAVDDGLLVPVLHNADTYGLAELAQQRRELVERAQTSKLAPTDLQGGTFTVSNLGMYGIDAFNAIVNPPQAAILAVGRIADRVVPVDGQPAVRPMLTLTLSCDHRVVDGARAAQFLAALAQLMEAPLRALE